MFRMTSVNTNYGSTVEVADIKKDSIENIISAAADCPKIDEIMQGIISSLTRNRLY